MSGMSEEKSYTAEEVASILKISRFTVYELIKRGDLQAYRVGRKVRVDAGDLENYKNKAKGHPLPDKSPILPVRDLPAGDQNSIIICGQDAILDVLTRHLETRMPHTRFLRKYVGSINGLTELYHGRVNIATAHLWDSDSDDYNIPYVRRTLPGYHVVIVNLVYRLEGFYVAAGNPKEIFTWSDLTRKDVRYVNREKGSGTRVLLDEKLRVLGIDKRLIQGYDCEKMSHLAVASYVAQKQADVGLGAEKAAMQVREVDFIPLQKERYDLIICQEDLEKPEYRLVLNILQSDSFREEIAGMGGYDISRMGEVEATI